MTMRGSRRAMMQGILALAAAEAMVRGAHARTSRSVVARARREGVVDPKTRAIDDGKLDALLGAALARATGDANPVAACQRLFRPNDVVGIKIGTLPGKYLSPHPKLVHRLCHWLKQAGVPANRIVIWDRSDRELTDAGYALNRGKTNVRCFGTNQDYEWSPREWGGGGSCFSQLLISELTALVSVAVLKDHDLAGISGGMKNWYGAIHNPNRCHDHGCDPYVAQLAAFPLIRHKLRLTIVDGLIAQCHGGPAYSPRWAWPWGGVLVSTDPVSVDAAAWQIIEQRRREAKLKSLAEEGRKPKWIATAERLGLGRAQAAQISVVDV